MAYRTNEQLNKMISESEFSMNSLSISFPYSYFSQLVLLNWYDILFAVENGYLEYQSIVEHAIVEIQNNEKYPKKVLDIACLHLGDVDSISLVQELLVELVLPISEDMKRESKNKLLYAVLSWTFKHKEHYEDALFVVEVIYADFGFPKSIMGFVRYMPIRQSVFNTLEENIKRMYKNWENFLSNQKAKYNP